MSTPRIPYTEKDLEKLRFRISETERLREGINSLNNKTYRIVEVKSGECYVEWGATSPMVPYAIHCVLEYLNRGIWIEV